jgi:hypothetical protein
VVEEPGSVLTEPVNVDTVRRGSGSIPALRISSVHGGLLRVTVPSTPSPELVVAGVRPIGIRLLEGLFSVGPIDRTKVLFDKRGCDLSSPNGPETAADNEFVEWDRGALGGPGSAKVSTVEVLW